MSPSGAFEPDLDEAAKALNEAEDQRKIQPAKAEPERTGRRAGHIHHWVRQRGTKFMENGVSKVIYQCSGCHVRKSARASATLSDG